MAQTLKKKEDLIKSLQKEIDEQRVYFNAFESHITDMEKIMKTMVKNQQHQQLRP